MSDQFTGSTPDRRRWPVALRNHWRSRIQASRFGRWTDRLLDGQPMAELPVLVVLILFTGALAGVSTNKPDWVTPTALALPIVIGGFLLSFRLQLVVLAAVGVGLGLEAAEREGGVHPGPPIIVGITAVLILGANRLRDQLGLRGTRADGLLIELSRQMQSLARLPAVRGGWELDSALVSATGRRISGDFLVADIGDDHGPVRIGLVDVSGKGSRAAARALRLSGAFSALLSSLEPDDFLPAANDYVARLSWLDEFATAVYVVIEPESGKFRVFNAGHPPVLHHRAADDSWAILDASGVILGIVPGERYEATEGWLAPGDALLLYTDGLVEVPGETLDVGVQRMVERAAPFLGDVGPGTAAAIVRAVARRNPDDRALVVVRRRDEAGPERSVPRTTAAEPRDGHLPEPSPAATPRGAAVARNGMPTTAPTADAGKPTPQPDDRRR